MSRFEGLLDQEKPLGILSGILAKGKIPHAFLLTGLDGIGKRTAAIRFAMACNCRGVRTAVTGSVLRSCGQCGSCVKILAGCHPDVIQVVPEGDIIKISQIRELTQRLTFRPHEAAARVVVISDAQTMNVEAANALLKALEEPPPETFFFLTAAQRADLLPTVVSRCQHIRFNPVAAEKIADYLIHHHGCAPDAARTAAIIAAGSVARALSLALRPEALGRMDQRRRWLADKLTSLSSSAMPVILLFAQKLASDKNHLLPSLEMMKQLLRDAVVGRWCPEKIVNADLREAVGAIAARYGPEILLSKINVVADAEQAVRQHANQRLVLEAMALRLADLAA